MHFTTVPTAFAAATADPARPLLTWYDDATGDRAELSGGTCANWVAKTANLLVDGCGLAAGQVALVAAPPHWQTAMIMLGCWSAGLVVTSEEPPEVVFAAAARAAEYAGAGERGRRGGAEPRWGRATDVFGLALAPLAAPIPDPPPGVTDFVTAVRAHGDHFSPPDPVGPETPATTLTHRELCRQAAARADAVGIRPGDRVLVDAAAHPDPETWLLAPLLRGASVVLCGDLDRAAVAGRVAAERVTVTLVAA